MRRAYFWLAAGLIAFTFYGSLLPFRLRAEPIGAAWSSFATIVASPSTDYFSRTNFLANTLLFVPVGFSLMGARLADRLTRRATLGLTALAMFGLGLLVSTLAEFLQVFAPGRIPSRSDIIAQASGCAIGIAVWIAAGAWLTSWLRESAARQRHDRLTRALTIYAALWLFAALAPFDISFDLGRVARRIRNGAITLVPFGSPAPLGSQIWDAIATTLVSVPLGMLALVIRQPPGARRRAGLAWALAAAAIVALEGVQIFEGFHGADITDVLFGWLGITIGIAAGVRIFGRTAVSHAFSSGSRQPALVLMGASVLVVCAYHWQPFDFGVDPQLVREKLQRVSLVPFAGYQTGSELNAFANLISKVAVAVPLGVCAAYALAPLKLSPALSALLLLAAIAFFGGVELGQLFIPSRVPDPSDVLVGVLSSAAGLWLGRRIRDQGSGIRDQ